MKLVKLVNGEPQPEPKGFEVTVHGYTAMIRCPCGMVWTTTVPSPGQQQEETCPSGCGHGIDMDARPVVEVDWLDLPPLEDTLKGLTYPTPEALRNVFKMSPDDICAARERAGLPVIKEFRDSLEPHVREETDAEFRERIFREGRNPVQRGYVGVGFDWFCLPCSFDWFCLPCSLGYYSPDVERSDDQMRPLCRCGLVLSGAEPQPPGLRWVGDGD